MSMVLGYAIRYIAVQLWKQLGEGQTVGLGTYQATHPCRCAACVETGMGLPVGKVVCRRMVLSMIVGQVARAFVPVKAKLALGGAAAPPVEAHPNHLDATLDDGVIGETRSCGVIRLDG